VKPNEIWCDFLNNIVEYSVYMVIDDNDFDVTDFKSKYSSINFIQIDDKECINAGFINSSSRMIKKVPISWDKGLYYFCVKNTDYSHVLVY